MAGARLPAQAPAARFQSRRDPPYFIPWVVRSP